jgi:prophage maintenance system killer protein
MKNKQGLKKSSSADDKQVAVYQSKSGALEIKKDFKAGTVWATQAQISGIFNVDQSVVSRHVSNIFKDGEIAEKSNMQKMHIANSDKLVIFYSLDIILAVGYRTNSARAIEFRKWATKTLRGYILDGYAINKKRVQKNYEQFLEAVDSVKQLLPTGAVIDTQSVLELINLFADTWFSLDAYDKDALITKGATKKRVDLSAEKLKERLTELKQALISRGEATALFGSERNAGNVAGIVGNIMQTFGGQDLYTSIEEKAAHLLYFMVKDHPFVDGNKRSGAYAFIWFLRQAKILNTAKMTPPALTALTILVAESNPKDKDKMIRLILTLLVKGK